jgi:hypothetical protein
MNFPANHWAHLGSTLGGKDLKGHITKADVILVFESDVPWVPHHNKPSPETVVYHIDCDPLKEQMRDALFVCDAIVSSGWISRAEAAYGKSIHHRGGPKQR